MTVIRWVRSIDPQKPANIRDEQFATKADALKAISRENISTIVKVPAIGGKLYVVTIKKG